ncbi:MAG: GTPase [Deltaproteobacteria bacterium]|nr:GTPase [Deltaproteobacteria bacterium]
MPANLPPEYFEVETRYKAARTTEERISCLEELISVVPKHKGTDKLRADLRRRLSKQKSAAQSKKGTAKQESAFRIDKEGAGQVAITGPPNTGKSSLLAALTNASPEIADFPYTTWRPTPGILQYENVQIQLIDTPPLYREYVEPELIDLIKRVDLILLMVDLTTDPVHQIEDTADLLQDYRIVPLRLKERFKGQTGFVFIPFFVLANKNDDEGSDEEFDILRELLEDDWPMMPISASTGRNLDRLSEAIFEKLDIIRVYSKAPGKEPDRTAPFVLKKGSTLADFAGKVHQDFARNLKAARVWGNAVYDGQMVQRDHLLQDGAVVELHM